MNAVIYARYSSDNQREESIEGQLRECKAFAEKNDIQIVGTYIVRGLTENAYICKFNGGTLPLGYTIDSEQHFQIDPLVAPAVLEAFKRYAEGASMTEIAQEMNAKGLRSAFGGKIGVDMVTRMLKTDVISVSLSIVILFIRTAFLLSFPMNYLTVFNAVWLQIKRLRQNTKPKTNIC